MHQLVTYVILSYVFTKLLNTRIVVYNVPLLVAKWTFSGSNGFSITKHFLMLFSHLKTNVRGDCVASRELIEYKDQCIKYCYYSIQRQNEH